jgi:MFS family permease
MLFGYVVCKHEAIVTNPCSLNVVLFALDQLIITVAVPQIVDEFKSLDKIEWLNTAFFIPCAGAILVYTQIMSVVSPKWTYLVSIAIFEAGSALCVGPLPLSQLIYRALRSL